MNNLRGVQINKYVSMQGICSRREADEWIKLGRVRINGKVAKVQDRVQSDDKVTVDDEYVGGQKKEKVSTYMLFYKQAGLTTTTDENDRTSVTRFIDYHKRIFPVGRLDKDSEGLLILTDDGDIVNKILRAGNRHDKEYVVEVDKLLAPDFCALMSAGVPILGTTTLPCVVKQEGSRKFRIILQQGLNRQIRRMCEYLGYKVKRLTRVRIMHLRVDGIRPGTWRLMTPVELQGLQKVLAASKNEDDVAGVRERGGGVDGRGFSDGDRFSDGGKRDRERGGRGFAGRDGAKAYRAGSDATPKSARHTPFDIPDIDDDELGFDVEDSRKRTPTTNQSRNTYWSDRKRGKRTSHGEEQGSGKAYGTGNVVGKAGRGGATKTGGSAKFGGATKTGSDKVGKGSKGERGAAAKGGGVAKPGGKAPQGKENKQVSGGGATKPVGKTGGKKYGASSGQAASGGKRINGSKGATTGGKPISGGKGFSGGSKGIKKQGKTR